MKNHMNVLRYLFDHDSGEFIDITKAFKPNNLPAKERIEGIYSDFKEYIETESIYNYTGLLGDGVERDIPILKAKITQKGRDYYLNSMNKRSTLKISKRGYYISIITVLLAIATFYFTIINPVFGNKEIKYTHEIFPNPLMNIVNNTADTIRIFPRQDYFIWFPSTILGNTQTVTGKYEMLTLESTVLEDLIVVPPGSLKVVCNILNKQSVYGYFKAEVNDLSLIIRTGPGQTYFSDQIPFSKKWIDKYYTVVRIDSTERY